ncbi:Leucine-rich repeat-containing protein 20 [Holothuria leucospilota]|uniref:Leucine-rich repeat-containing protein 20 n=1 Tax=Holothuria leucospilota TaxID=206669 RepID=A0A9Q0YJP2_HOLLE|nr:Leucine-rich repeat-containing protein 20 [Holothuria leucospilota]
MSAAAAVTRVVRRCNDAAETQKLDLSSCILESFPDAVFHLLRNTVVLSCNLSNNNLKKVVGKLCQNFTQLTELNICDNQIDSLPDSIGLLTQLRTFAATQNKLVGLPTSFYSLEKLETLELGSNEITELDVERLCNMPALKKVVLLGNPLTQEVHQQLLSNANFELIVSDVVDNFSDVD